MKLLHFTFSKLLHFTSSSQILKPPLTDQNRTWELINRFPSRHYRTEEGIKGRRSEYRLEMLHMNGGDGEMSYSKNSVIQRELMTSASSIREEAITRLHNSAVFLREGGSCRLAMAELGCSSGPNALLVARQLITTVHRIGGLPEFQVFLNDLPGNDFNAIFKVLPEFYQELKDEIGVGFGSRSCFVNAVPGSFYGRLFPSKSMHFFHSSACLHWLSQVPKGVERSRGGCHERLKSAYYEQFRGDFSIFLKCRAEELVSGGCMVFTMPVRHVDDDHEYSSCYLDHLMEILIQMTVEGMIDKEKMDNFNVPLYTPSMEEIEKEVSKEGSFSINNYQLLDVALGAFDDGDDESKQRAIERLVGAGRAAMEPLFLSHFGKGIPIHTVFQRCKNTVIDLIVNVKPINYFTTVSLTK